MTKINGPKLIEWFAKFRKQFVFVFTAIASFLFGDIGYLFITLMFLSTFDYILGYQVAKKNKVVDSKVMYLGLVKKGVIYGLVAVGHLIDNTLIVDIGLNTQYLVRNYLTVHWILYELLSILENAVLLGLDLPEEWIDSLDKLQGSSSKLVVKIIDFVKDSFVEKVLPGILDSVEFEKVEDKENTTKYKVKCKGKECEDREEEEDAKKD